MRRFFTNLCGCAMAVFALLGTACTPDTEDKLPTPNFPAAITNEVSAGEIYALAIEPNQPWTVSIPEDATYFTILDNENEVYSISGEKGPHEIQIKVADIRDYNESHQCEVTMTMGSAKQVIATLNLGKLIRKIEIYDVLLEDNQWVYGEDTQFSYATEQVGTDGIMLNWGENGQSMFTHRIKIVSNFTWKIDGTPEWIQAISNNESDVTELWIKGDGAKYPTEASSATLSFLDAEDNSVAAVATLKVSIPAVSSVFSFNDFDEVSKFNHHGEIYSAFSASYYEGNAEGSVISINENMHFYTLSFETNYGMTFPTFGHDWITSNIDAWDTSDSNLIQTRNISIGVTENNGGDREAVVLVIPQSVVDTFEDANEPYEVLEMAAGGMGASGELVEEYKKYVVTTVKQAAHPGPITLTNAAEMTTIQFVKVSGNSDVSYDYPTAQHGYELLYTSKYDNDDAVFQFEGTYTSVEYTYFDDNSGNLKSMSESETWVKVTSFGTDGGFRLTMNPTAATNKHWKTESYYNGAYWSYVAFKNGDDVVAVISALYNENYDLAGNGSDATTGLSFSYPQYAIDMDGSSLVELTSGDVWQSIVGNYGEIPVWHLTHTKSPATMSGVAGINTEWTPSYVDETDKSWLTFEGGEMATVSMKTEGNGKSGILIFKDANLVPKLALVCTLNIAQ